MAGWLAGWLAGHPSRPYPYSPFAGRGPGLEHAEVYGKLVKDFQRRLRDCGVPVVTDAPGVKLAADGVHWRASSKGAVEKLICEFAQAAVPTIKFKDLSPPNLWCWQFMPTWNRGSLARGRRQG